ncbi:MAG: hypothetical protein QXT64_02215 [Desulfurococcaceae archaeon]
MAWGISVAITVVTFFLFIMKNDLWWRMAILAVQAFAGMILYLIFQYAAYTQNAFAMYAASIALIVTLVFIMLELVKMLIEAI